MPTLGWVRTALLFSAAQRSKPRKAFNFKQSSDELPGMQRKGLRPVLSTHVAPRPCRFELGAPVLDPCRRSRLVELTGIEPVTPCLQSRCSPS